MVVERLILFDYAHYNLDCLRPATHTTDFYLFLVSDFDNIPLETTSIQSLSDIMILIAKPD